MGKGMNHKLYIASTLPNAKTVQRLRNLLAWYQIRLTYDWTIHNDGVPFIPDSKPVEKRIAAEREIQGVQDAECVLVVMPGGRGTHFEFGVAYILNKPIVLLVDKRDTSSPSFHFLNNIVRVTTQDAAFKAVLDKIYPDGFKLPDDHDDFGFRI